MSWPLHPPVAPTPAPPTAPLEAAAAPLEAPTVALETTVGPVGPATSGGQSEATRLVGVDVARAIAMIGMVIAHYVVRDPGGGALDSVRAFVDGRAMPLFVLLGGVGVTLAARRAAHPDRALLLRAVVLFPLGLLLQEVTVGIAIILQYYALFFVVAVGLRRLPGVGLWAVALVVTALGGVAFQLTPTWPTYEGWAGWSALGDAMWWKGLATALTVNGYYPLAPTLAFLAVGMWLGRQRLDSDRVAATMLAAGMVLGLVGYVGGRALASAVDTDGIVRDAQTGRSELAASIAADLARVDGISVAELRRRVDDSVTLERERDEVLASLVDYHDHVVASFRVERLADAAGHSHMPAWVLGATGSATAVLGASLLAARRLERPLVPLVVLGQFALTFYVAQAVLIRWTVERGTTSIGAEFRLCAAIVVGFTLAALVWRRWLGRGPLEATLRLVAR